MESILGLYEFPGGGDNAAILAMAKQCGGALRASTSTIRFRGARSLCRGHLITTGFLPVGKGSLSAGDFRALTSRLDGPAVGAIGVKARTGGNHTFIVRGRTADGRIVGPAAINRTWCATSRWTQPCAWFGWPRVLRSRRVLAIGTLPSGHTASAHSQSLQRLARRLAPGSATPQPAQGIA
jgi:hypothetical protein